MDLDSSRIVLFEFRGFQGKPAICQLEILQLRDGEAAVIATKREESWNIGHKCR